MTFFSRCETSQVLLDSGRISAERRGGVVGRVATGLLGFVEDLSILFRYAAGLDYVGHDLR